MQLRNLLNHSVILLSVFFISISIGISACTSNVTDAQIASKNLSLEADSFQIVRRVVFYDSIQGRYLLSIEGRCSIDIEAKNLEVTCKTSNTEYKKHFLGLADNVTFFAEQLKPSNVSEYRYKVIFKPESIIPDVDLKTSLGN